MGVDGARQTVVSEQCLLDGARGEVDGLHHAPGGNHPEHRVEEGVGRIVSAVERVCQGFPVIQLDLEAACVLASHDQRLEV